jgi:acetylornithine deacetylase/succinyl-diaminopimelate desuccinylase-like protein
MLNLTASMAVAMRQLATEGFKPRGNLVFVACADEESASTYGMRWLADNQRDAIYADYVLTENGGIHSGDPNAPIIGINVAEKGVAWRRLKIHGVPGHGSTPFRAHNALVKAAAVVTRLAEYTPPPKFHELWRQQVERLGLDAESEKALLDETRIDKFLEALPIAGMAAYLHACTHTTFSCNVAAGVGMKTNVIPATVELDVDIRTVPGDNADEVMAHLRNALGDLADDVDVDVLTHSPASMSPIDTPAWDALHRAVTKSFPGASLAPSLIVGFTDARIYRELGSVAYGAGLLSPEVNAAEFGRRFHGNDERIDVESLRLTTDLWLDVARDLLG